jgi:hypothetical protein
MITARPRNFESGPLSLGSCVSLSDALVEPCVDLMFDPRDGGFAELDRSREFPGIDLPVNVLATPGDPLFIFEIPKEQHAH